MKPRLLAAAAMVACVAAVQAASTITTVVDGVAETRELVKMTFDQADPSAVTLHFADSSTLTADMELVSIALDHSGASDIDAIVNASLQASGVYNLKGQRVADSLDAPGLAPGLYITGGNKILIK